MAPPGNWHFTHPGGFNSAAITFPALVGKVAQYRANRNEPVVSEGFNRLSDEVEDHICRKLSPEDQQSLCDTGVTIPNGVHWTEVVRFLKTMVAWVKVGFRKVDAQEANRRAAICIKCPLNVGLRGCAICKITVGGLRDQLLGGSSTSHDDKLMACGVCGCDNKAQVHVPLDVLKAGGRELNYPSYCWKFTPTA